MTIVDLGTGSVVKTIPGDTSTVTSVAIKQDGSVAFVASQSLQCRRFDLDELTSDRSWRAHQAPVMHMCLDSQDMYLATAGADGNVKVWDATEGYATHVLKGHAGTVQFVLFHHVATRYELFSCGDDGEVRVWDLQRKACKRVLKAHISAVTSLSLSPCGGFVVSGGRDNLVHVWDVNDGRKVSSIPVNEATNAAVFLCTPAMRSEGAGGVPGAKNGKPVIHFVTTGQAGKLKFWNPQKLLCEYEYEIDDTCEAEGGCLDFVVLDSNRLLCTTVDCRIVLYNLKTSVESFRTDLSKSDRNAFWKGQLRHSSQIIGNNEQITDVAFLDSKRLVVATNSQYIRIYDAHTFDCLSSCSGHEDIVLALHTIPVDSSHHLIASGGKDNTLRVWACSTDGSRTVCKGKAEGHFSAIECLSFSTKVAKYVCTGDADGFLKLWDLATLSSSEVGGDAFSPLNMESVSTVAGHQKDVNAVAFSPDNKLICSGSQDKLAKLWIVPSFAPFTTLRGHGRGVWGVSFSPIDKVVATCSGDKTIRLWSTSQGTCLRSFEGHTASVLKVQFISVGVQLLSTGADGLIKVWNVRSAECAATLDEHEDRIWALTSLNGGETFATGSGDGEVLMWRDCTEEKAMEAKRAGAEMIGRHQKVQDAMQKGKHSAAFRLALDLQYPTQLHAVIAAALKVPEGADGFWREVIHGLSDGDITQCLKYAAEWNTNARFYLCGQLLVQHIFTHVHPDRLASLPGLIDTWGGLQAYSQRHAKRIDTLLRTTYLLDYTLASRSVPTAP